LWPSITNRDRLYCSRELFAEQFCRRSTGSRRKPLELLRSGSQSRTGSCNCGANGRTLVAKLSWKVFEKMMDRAGGTEGREESAILIPLHEARRERLDLPITFQRRELDDLLRLYGRMVAANEWRDYAIDHLADRAVFSVFRRTSETPLYRIVKNPSLARRQGAWSVVSAAGFVLKRSPELQRVLGVFDKQLKLVEA
jgi:hypothetical protein